MTLEYKHMKTNIKKSVFPKEEMWLIFLVIGFLGALTIAHENFILVYQGEISGQHAMAIGYLLAGIASIGLFICYRGMQKSMGEIPKLSRLFWIVYAVCMALPFVFDRLKLPQPAEGVLLTLSLVSVSVFGHYFYSTLRKVEGDQSKVTPV